MFCFVWFGFNIFVYSQGVWGTLLSLVVSLVSLFLFVIITIIIIIVVVVVVVSVDSSICGKHPDREYKSIFLYKELNLVICILHYT